MKVAVSLAILFVRCLVTAHLNLCIILIYVLYLLTLVGQLHNGLCIPFLSSLVIDEINRTFIQHFILSMYSSLSHCSMACVNEG